MHDTADDICHVVNVCNHFCSLPIEHVSMVESGVEGISATPADYHSTKSMDSGASIPSVSCESPWRSSGDGDHSSSQDLLLSCAPTLESFIQSRNSYLLVVSGVQSISTIISTVDNLYSVDPGTQGP